MHPDGEEEAVTYWISGNKGSLPKSAHSSPDCHALTKVALHTPIEITEDEFEKFGFTLCRYCSSKKLFASQSEVIAQAINEIIDSYDVWPEAGFDEAMVETLLDKIGYGKLKVVKMTATQFRQFLTDHGESLDGYHAREVT